MGTRGLMGFVVDGNVKASYNHYDSYPSALGVSVGEFAATLTGDRLSEYTRKARVLALVDEESKPTADDRKRFAVFTDLSVSERGEDWYSVLRNLQGDPGAMLDAGVMIDSLVFAQDSLFCEWGYLINFDTGMVEVYRGFQKDPAAVVGRFANGESERDYTSITLLGQLPFTAAADAAFWQRVERVVYEAEEHAEEAALAAEVFAHPQALDA